MDSARSLCVLLLLLAFSSLSEGAAGTGKQSSSSNAVQRSKEANCLIQGYHTCLLNLLSPNGVIASTAPSTSTASHVPSSTRNNNTNAADCFRLSGTSAAPDNRSQVCGSNECPWDGSCLKSGVYSENDGFYSVEDLPIATYYENVHTITISFPKYLDTTVLYVLETRPVSNDANGQQAPFRFAGVSNQTTISYRVFNICNRYEFRPTAILSNGSVITFLPKTSNSNPADFMVDNVRMASLRFSAERHQVVANVTWKHPYGYTNMDVVKYEIYLHTLQCDAPSDLLNDVLTDTIVKTDDGGFVTATFPEQMVERKCQFRFMVWAINACGNRTLTDAKIDIVLNCTTVEGYRCPAAELRPVCVSHVDVAPVPSTAQSESNVSVNVSWTPMVEARPQYYHIRWGLARVMDLRRRGQGEEVDDSGDESRRRIGEGRSRPRSASKRWAKPVSKSKSTGRSQSHEQMRRPRNSPDFSVWMLLPESVTQEKVPGDTPYITLSNFSSNSAYGVQVCAIFNGDFKRPEWPKVTTSGFTCSCADAECSSASGVQCDQKSTSSYSALYSASTQLPTIRPPLAVVLGVPQPPDNIDTISDFTQTLVSTESDGIRMRLTWKPPKNLLKEQILGYDVAVETLLPCERAPACCDYVEFAEIAPTRDNVTGTAELFLPVRVLHSQCEFVAKITTTAINGASSVSLKNIRVPALPSPLSAQSTTIDDYRQNSSCWRLQCSHSCNSSHCLCPADLVLNSDGRTCSAASELMPNDSPVEDCIAQFGCYFNLCDKNGCVCPLGYNMSLDGLTCVNAASGAAILQGEPASSLFDYCQGLGCKFTCTPKGDCACPSNMKLSVDGKSCDYEDPDVWNSTAPVPLPEKPVTPSIMCASPSRSLFSWSKDGGIWLKWKTNSSAFSAFELDSEIRVRLGAAVRHSDDVVLIYRLRKDAIVASTSLAAESIHLATPPSSDRLGVQFCIYNSHQWNRADNESLMNWDIVPVILLRGDHGSSEEDQADGSLVASAADEQRNVKAHRNHSSLHELANAGGPTDSDHGFKKTIAMAVVIPVSCIIILASLLALLCYFYSAPMQKCWARQRARLVSRNRSSGLEGPSMDGVQKSTSNSEGVKIRVRDIAPPMNRLRVEPKDRS